jgi:hypothetical protein
MQGSFATRCVAWANGGFTSTLAVRSAQRAVIPRLRGKRVKSNFGGTSSAASTWAGRVRGAQRAAGLPAHIGLWTRADLRRHGIDRLGRRQEQRAEVVAAPSKIADRLFDAQPAHPSARGVINPDAAGRRLPKCCRLHRISSRRERPAPFPNECRRRRPARSTASRRATHRRRGSAPFRCR